MKSSLADLRQHLKELYYFSGIQSLLGWDQETFMPKGAADLRANQLSFLSKLKHEAFCSKEFDSCLGKHVDLQTGEVDTSLDESNQAIIRETYKDWLRVKAVPSDFNAEFVALQSKSTHVWQEAREKNDFTIFRPFLEALIDKTKQYANYINPDESVYDVLLDMYEPDMKKDDLYPLFKQLSDKLPPLLKQIQAKQSQSENLDLSSFTFDKSKQWDFGLEILKDMGFNSQIGRQDISTHPFTTNFGLSDIRITTRVHPHKLMEALSSTIHEGGHALYEQGFLEEWEGTPLAEAASLGIHESQSRLYEHVVGNSYAFWETFYAKLQSYFPDVFSKVPLDLFYRSIHHVNPDYIRVEADEVTYNLHILIRFECEDLIFNKHAKVSDLKSIWEEKYQNYLGLDPKDDAHGILQDVHWSSALFGYFPTYTLGNLYSVQLFETMKQQRPTLARTIDAEALTWMNGWLKQNIYQHGRKYHPKELMTKITGQPLDTVPFLDYLEKKYLERI